MASVVHRRCPIIYATHRPLRHVPHPAQQLASVHTILRDALSNASFAHVLGQKTRQALHAI